MRDSGRNLLHVVGDEDRGWCVVILSELAQGVDQRLAAGKVQAGGRLVEEQQLRIGHQGPSDLHPLAFALAQCAECAIRQSVDAELGEQLVGRSWSSSSYCSRHRPSTAYEAETTTS